MDCCSPGCLQVNKLVHVATLVRHGEQIFVSLYLPLYSLAHCSLLPSFYVSSYILSAARHVFLLLSSAAANIILVTYFLSRRAALILGLWWVAHPDLGAITWSNRSQRGSLQTMTLTLKSSIIHIACLCMTVTMFYTNFPRRRIYRFKLCLLKFITILLQSKVHRATTKHHKINSALTLHERYFKYKTCISKLVSHTNIYFYLHFLNIKLC